MFVNFNILNQLGSPAINSNTFANRPAAGQTGRLFVSTDTFEIYRDNGTSWDLIGGPGSSTITGTGTATQVAYFTSSQAIGSSANLFWDNTSGFLGVATATPTARIEAVKTDGIGIYANYTTNAGSGSSATAIWAKNVTNSSGFAAVIEETTPNATAGQYPLLIKHSLSSGTAGVGMGTGVHWQLPDDAGTFKTTQLTIETINAAAATYATRYRFNVQSNGSSTPVAYINATGLGIFTATPGAALDIHSTGIMAQLNSTSATGNTYIAFQRTGSGLWRIGDTYNGGNNFFELHNTVLGTDALEFEAATNKSVFVAQQIYTTGLARGNYFDYNLSVAAGGSFSSPNAITALTATLDLTLAGNATIPSGARSGLDAYNSISFNGAGTLTLTQGTQIRAYSNLTTGWAFNGNTGIGTVTHLAGLRVLFPDNTGNTINVTNNYALLLNDQTANTGTVTYTNRWGIYQEGASDLNYMAANLLLGSTTNNGNRLQITGSANATGAIIAGGGNAPTLGFQLPNTSGVNTPRLTNDASNATVLRTGASGSSIKFNNFANSSEMMLITDTGLLGLGISPSAKFDVQTTGQTLMRIEIPNVAQLNIGNGGNSINYYDANTQIFRTGTGTEVMRTTSAALVGIATSNPTETLEVLGNAAVTGTGYLALQRQLIPVGENGSTGLNFRWYSTGTTYETGAAIRGSSEAAWTASSCPARMIFLTTPSGSVTPVERMRINSVGNVGIGVTPTNDFEIGGRGNGNNIVTRISTVNASGSSTRSTTTYDANTGLVTFVSDAGGNGSNRGFAFTTQATERLRISSVGFVGINTSTPTNTLQSYGGAITVNDWNTYAARFSNNSNKGLIVGYDTTNNQAHIGSVNPGVAWTSTILNANGGNVLIGTTTDAGQKLQVNGTISVLTSGNSTVRVESTGTFPLFQLKGTGAVTWNIESGRSITNTFGIYQSGGSGGGSTYFSIAEGGATSINSTLAVTSSITTGAPSGGTAAPWKLGSKVTTGGILALDVSNYIEVEINGVFYKLGIVN